MSVVLNMFGYFSETNEKRTVKIKKKDYFCKEMKVKIYFTER